MAAAKEMTSASQPPVSKHILGLGSRAPGFEIQGAEGSQGSGFCAGL